MFAVGRLLVPWIRRRRLSRRVRMSRLARMRLFLERKIPKSYDFLERFCFFFFFSNFVGFFVAKRLRTVVIRLCVA